MHGEESRMPAEIVRLTEGLPAREEGIGMSGARVWVYPDRVLKVQPAVEAAAREVRVCTWGMSQQLPIPRILAYEERDGLAWTLMTRIQGRMLCDPDILREPERLVRLAAQALRRLWAVDISACPMDAGLDTTLRLARQQVLDGKVDLHNTEPETFGPGGFETPADLLRHLETHRPVEELVLSHGDLCLPNIFAEGEDITGLIDIGGMGIADRWRDIAICCRSIRHNLSGKYAHGQAVPFDPAWLLSELGIPMNEEKMRYYLLMDELF